jgi:xylose isomerase
MSYEYKLASNLVPFSRVSDRFVASGYHEGVEYRKKLEMAAAIDGITGAAAYWPCGLPDGFAIKKLFESAGLKVATIDADIYTDATFKNGALSNPDPKIRRAAIDRIKATIDAGIEAGAPDMNLWLGHDGFEYTFSGHYDDVWKLIVEGLQEVAEYNSKLPISLEYKLKEPRAFEYVANVGIALLLVKKINKPHLGITLDTGHSLAALENPANAAVLAMREGRLQGIHLNDNYRDWDHDLIPCSVNLFEHIEFFYWLRKLGYDGWFTFDIFPYRDDGTEVTRRTVQNCRTCWKIAEKLMEKNVDELLHQGQRLEIMRMVWDIIGGC